MFDRAKNLTSSWLLGCLLIVLSLNVAACSGGGAASSQVPQPPTPVLQSIAVSPPDYSVELGVKLKLAALGIYSDGSSRDLTDSAAWTSASTTVATIDSTGNATAAGVGSTVIKAVVGAVIGSTTLSVKPDGLLKNAGLWVQFERRGAPSGYNSGEIIQDWDEFDPLVNSTVGQEVSLQLDKMKAMGVNTITFQLRTSDPTYTGNFTPPDCNEPPVLGLQFPQPTAIELQNLPRFFDAVEAKGMRIWLSLVNTHMEQQPPTNSQRWLAAILGAVGKHPALDLVSFDGDTYTDPGPNGTAVCGIPAEAPLWLGLGSVQVTYVQWAISFAMSQGLSSRKLAAEAIVGDAFLPNQPIDVEKSIFDNLGIPANERTYVLSFYEHRRCSDAQTSPCSDLDPHDWADQTLQYVTSITGAGPRTVALEMGDRTPVDPIDWNTPHAMESLVFLLRKYGLDGGSFWRWTSFNTSEDSDPTLAQPLKIRGVPFAYNSVRREILDMAGVHLASVPNGLFATASTNGGPSGWVTAGSGTVAQYMVSQEPGEPEVPSRGDYAMRIITGSGTGDSVTATSTMIPVNSETTYTTTANMRFAWSGDPNPQGSPASRPQISVTVLYFQQNATPSSIHPQDTFAYFQEDSTSGFATFPVQYATPSDAAFVAIRFGAARNGLPAQMILDVQNVR